MRSTEARRSDMFVRLIFSAAVSFLCVGCFNDAVIGTYIGNLRRSDAALDTVHDFRLARSMVEGNLAQLEGLYALSPSDEDALYLLTRYWGMVSTVFLVDTVEIALAANEPAWAEYHGERVRAALERARFYALALLETHDDGARSAVKDPRRLSEWLREHFEDAEDAEELMWAGIAWAPHLPRFRDTGAGAVGMALVGRALELDERVEHGLGHVVAGLFHTVDRDRDPARANRHFSRAISVTNGRFLPSRLAMAASDYCVTGDEKRYETALRRISAERDPLPAARVWNLAAIREARRRLAGSKPDCSFGMALPGTVHPEPRAGRR